MIILGVDGGGSKTFAVTADERGRVVGFGRGGCGNYEGPGLEAAMAEIGVACRGAVDAAGAARAHVGCFCLAGADFPEDFDMLTKAVRALDVADAVIVYNDTRAAFAAGSRRGYGAVVIMGSGMNAAGFAPDGRDCRLPGEGFLFGDWGGAGSIGSEVMHRVFRAHDGRGEPTALTAMVLDRLGVPDIDGLTRQLNHGQIPSAALGRLTLLVFEAAATGDTVARGIAERVAEETALAALAMLRRVGLEGSECDVVLGGGVYKAGGAMLLDLATKKIRAQVPGADVIVPSMEPVIGAAILALEKAGVTPDDAVRANLQQGNDRLVAPYAVPSQNNVR
ncbi:MAG: kinase [Armatimonadota bacterium]|nr:MAG: kinase [Armatimonadota bacterium]